MVTVRQEAVERQAWGRWAPWKPGQSGTSARALLLTLLGEFVLPDGGRAWAATLIEALSLLDVEARTSAAGHRQDRPRRPAGIGAVRSAGELGPDPRRHPVADPGRGADLRVRVPDRELGRPVAHGAGDGA